MSDLLEKENINEKKTDYIKNQIYKIISDSVGPEGRLPSERVIAQQFSMSRGTVRQALDALSAEGLIEKRPGSGNYVKQYCYSELKVLQKSIALVIPLRDSNLSNISRNNSELIAGCNAGAEEKSYHLILKSCCMTAYDEACVLKSNIINQVAGVGILSVDEYKAYSLTTHLRNKSIPVLFFDRAPKYDDVYSVTNNDLDIAYTLTSELIKRGHSHILFIGTSQGGIVHESMQDRLRGYNLALMENNKDMKNCKYDIIEIPYNQSSADKKNFSEKWRQYFSRCKTQKYTAIFFANNIAANGYLKAWKKAGIDKKDSTEIVGVHPVEDAFFINRQIAYSDISYYEMGRQGAKLLCELAENPTESGAMQIVLNGKIKIIKKDI